MAFPYNPYTNPYMQQPQQPPTQSLIWVQGEAGAKSYLVAPGQTVALWDSENQTIYLKSADASGMPSMRILDYKIRDAMNAPKSELEALAARIKALEDKLNESTVSANAAT